MVTLDFDCKIEILVGSWAIREHREPGRSVLLPNAKIERRPVTNRPTAVTPLATLLDRNSFWIDIVLARGCLAFPDVIIIGIRAGQFFGGTRINLRWNRLGFAT